MNNNGYTWSCMDVLRLVGVPFNPNKEENIIPCPFCGGKRFAMNIRKGTGHCFSAGCNATADSVGYYAETMGKMSLFDARRAIKEALNIKDENGKVPERLVFKPNPQSELAAIEERDKAYRAFLDELVLSQKNRDNLLARGFSLDDIAIKGYKTMPTYQEVCFEDICNRIQTKGISLKGVPGFYKNKSGSWTFVRVTKGIIIPQVNPNNQIEGFQIRKDDDLRVNLETGELEPKCVWFSSKNYPEGTGAKTSVHIATDFVWDEKIKNYIPLIHGNTVTLTEGGMKADLCQCIMDGKMSLIAIQGVYALNPLKACLLQLKQYGLERVNIAFDMDYLTNPNVKDAMVKAVKLIEELGLKPVNLMNWMYEVQRETGEKFYLKGLDDYLAYQYKHVIPIPTK